MEEGECEDKDKENSWPGHRRSVNQPDGQREGAGGGIGSDPNPNGEKKGKNEERREERRSDRREMQFAFLLLF